MTKWINGQEIIQAFESFAPKNLAVEGDKIGLQIGSLNKKIKKVMITLDVLEEVVDEAIENEVDLIIAHHPIIFRPIKQIRTDQPYGRIIEKCIKHDITIYVAHTNLDVAKGGVNDMLANALHLTETEVLAPTVEISLKKLVVFVPKDHAEKVRGAISDAGAGYIGNYSHCTFNVEGVGTFLPREGSDPFIGEANQLEEVNEIRIETIFPENIQSKVIQAMKKTHPYEEVAFDIYPVESKGEQLGLGRVGKLKEKITLEQFVQVVKQAFDVEGVRVVGDLTRQIKKVAVLGGDGNKYISAARFKGADVFITGDLYYHVAHDAMMDGLSIIDPGHNIEKVMKIGVQKIVKDYLLDKSYDSEVIVSNINTDPFKFL